MARPEVGEGAVGPQEYGSGPCEKPRSHRASDPDPAATRDPDPLAAHTE